LSTRVLRRDHHGVSEVLGRLIAASPRRALLLSLLLTACAAWGALQFQLDTGLTALFPDTPAAADYRRYLEIGGTAEKIYVVVRPAERESLLEVVDLLAAELRDEAPIAEARAGVDTDDERFFTEAVIPSAALLMSDQERARLDEQLSAEAVRTRVREVATALGNPAGGFATSLLRADPLGLSGPILARRSGSAAAMIDPDSGAFLSKDRSAALIVVTPRSADVNPETGRALRQAIERATARTRQQFETPFEIDSIGGALYAAHDEELLREDLKATVGGSLGGVTLFLILAFEGALLPIIGVISLLAGVIWTGAAVAIGYGALTGVGVGFAAMLIGLGDDIVLHACTRYRSELAEGSDPRTALVRTFDLLGAPMLGAAMTTVVAFAALCCSNLRPIRELGGAIAAGVLLTLASAAVVGGPLLALTGSRLSRRRPWKIWRWTERLIDGITGRSVRYRPIVLSITAVLTIVSIFGWQWLTLDTDPRVLRPKGGNLEQIEKLVQEQFAVGLEATSIVVRGASEGEVLDRAAALERVLGARLPQGAELFSASQFVLGPAEQARRAPVLGRLASARALFEHEAQEANLNIAAFSWPKLQSSLRPAWLRESLSEKNGVWYATIYVRVPIEAWRAGPPSELIDSIRSVQPDAIVASIPRVGRELRDTARTDFRWLALAAGVLIVLCVAIQFRGELRSLLAGFVPVALASVWIFGLWGWLGWTLDLVSLIVIPIILGVGIDDGLHVAHAARTQGSMLLAARHAGRGILVSNTTTIIGFWSLTASRVPGLKNAGALIALGITICMLASLVVMPALERRKQASG
jgi:predicted RND superfamily exporter protein